MKRKKPLITYEMRQQVKDIRESQLELFYIDQRRLRHVLGKHQCWLPTRIQDFRYLNDEMRKVYIKRLLRAAKRLNSEVEILTEAFQASMSLSPDDFRAAVAMCLAYQANITATSILRIMQDGSCLGSLLERLHSSNRADAIAVQAKLTYRLDKCIGNCLKERKFLLALAVYLDNQGWRQAHSEDPKARLSLPQALPTDLVRPHHYKAGEHVAYWERDSIAHMYVGEVLDPMCDLWEMCVQTVIDSVEHYGLLTVTERKYSLGSQTWKHQHGIARQPTRKAFEIVAYSHLMPWSVFSFYRDNLELIDEHLAVMPDSGTLKHLRDYMAINQVKK